MCKSFVCKFKVNRICTNKCLGTICNQNIMESCSEVACKNCMLSDQCSLCKPNLRLHDQTTGDKKNENHVQTKITEKIDLGKAYAFVDGSYNKETKVYGYGGYLIDTLGKQHLLQGSGCDPEMSSMRNVSGEILGAEAAMKKAEELGLKELDIYYDYTGIEAWVTGKWRANKKGTIRYRDVMKQSCVKISFVKVKGHSGVVGNEKADRLAKQAVGLYT